MNRIGIAALLVAIVAIGCDGGYKYDARNDSDAAVIVLFGGTSAAPDVTGYRVPPHTYGLTMAGMGGAKWRGRVRVVDPECNLLWQDDIDADVGGVLVGADGTITWVTEGTSPLPSQEPSVIKMTTTCARGSSS